MRSNLNSIFITGSSGFLGTNIISYLKNNFRFNFYKKESEIQIYEDIVLHLAGKAHDLKSNIEYQEYYDVNTELTKNIYDSFLISDAEIFIYISSVKASADSVSGILKETNSCEPKTHYGKSKLLAEKYILSKNIPINKRVYILRPCMIHGPNNKGNLNLLYNIVVKRIPWILGSFHNKRSYCSIDNFMFIIKELINNKSIPSGVYNVADDEYLSTNEIVALISHSNKQKPIIFNISPTFIRFIAKIGDKVPLPLNTERLNKLTESYMVSNSKIMKYIEKELPLTCKQGILKTFESFKKNYD